MNLVTKDGQLNQQINFAVLTVYPVYRPPPDLVLLTIFLLSSELFLTGKIKPASLNSQLASRLLRRNTPSLKG